MINQYKIKRVLQSNLFRILVGILFLVLGIFFLIRQTILTFPLGLFFGATSVYHLSLLLMRIDISHQHNHFIQFLSYGIVSLFLLYRNNFVFSILGLILVLWVFINTIIRLLNIYFYYLISKKFKFLDILLFMINLIFSMYLFQANQVWKDVFIWGFGGYLIYYGIEMILLIFRDKILKQPSMLSVFLPVQFLGLSKKNVIRSDQNESVAFDLDVVNIYVYLGPRAQEKIGHIDIGYKGKIYSYGAHDPNDRNKFFLWGNGVLIVADENRFTNFSLKDDHKTVIKFVYHLNHQERIDLENQIENLMNQTIEFPWAKENTDYEHYAPRVNRDVGSNNVKFYLFKPESIFKTYNLFKINCVSVSYFLLNTSKFKLFDISGLVTPGAYFETLTQIYNQPESPILEMIVLQNKVEF